MVAREVEILMGLLVAVAALVTLSRRTWIPYPVWLVLGGLALAFIPGVPAIAMRPEIVFLVFLPPLLFRESINAPLSDFKTNARSIFSLAVGLVLATTVVVAWVAHRLIPGMTWPAAFVLGAVLAPTDEVAVTEVAERLSVPRRAMAVLEGESLINDAISLVAYRMAITAAVTNAFSLGRGALQFLAVSLGGVAIGLGVGWLVALLRRRLHDPPVENTISLLTPFAAYVPADAIGVSGVLSVVTIGLYLGRLSPRLISSRVRLQVQVMWEMIAFLLNGLLFILTGLQIRLILHAKQMGPLGPVLGYTAVLILTLIAIRFVWLFVTAYLTRALIPGLRRRDPYPPWQQLFLVSWTGIRGGLSLVAALAIPFTIAGGVPFPNRSLIIGISFFVILATLLLQGLTLPWLIRLLRLDQDGSHEREEDEETRARLVAARAALNRLEALRARHGGRRSKRAPGVALDDLPPDQMKAAMLDDLRDRYVERLHRYTARVKGDDDDFHEDRDESYRKLRRDLLHAERDAVLKLRDEGRISDDTLRRIQRDLDLDELRLTEPEQA
ncbi:MAG TPA: Na+/H+ antiporter [Chthonomonadaceae bacterium]|nr:Na+/H+ antiporter [Chthonomonadaceae bacterium]